MGNNWIEKLEIGDLVSYDKRKRFSVEKETVIAFVKNINNDNSIEISKGINIDKFGCGFIGGGFETEKIKIKPVDSRSLEKEELKRLIDEDAEFNIAMKILKDKKNLEDIYEGLNNGTIPTLNINID